MAGYTRQSVADIVNGANITAPPLNAEFNTLAAAFNGTTGHTHTGGIGDGPKIELTTSVAGYLPQVHGGVGGKNNTQATANPNNSNDVNSGYAPGSIWINANTGRLFICMVNSPSAAVWAEAVGITPFNQITPENDNTVDIGSPAYQFKDLYINGTGYIDAVSGDTLALTSTATVGGALTVTGATTGSTLTLTSNASVGGNLGVTGDTTVSGDTYLNGNTVIGNTNTDTVNVNATISTNLVPTTDNSRDLGTATSEWRNLYIDGTANIDSLVADTADINAGSIDNTPIGAGTQSTAAFTGLTVSSTATFAGATIADLGSVTTADINGGTIDGVTIGTNSAVTDLRVDNIKVDGNAITSTNTNGNISVTPNGTGSVVISKADINSGTIDGTTIGASSHTSGKFTTLQSTGQATLATVDINGGAIDGTAIGASATSTGAFTTVSASGGFTGNLTGNVTGNVTGNTSGTHTGSVTGDVAGNVTSTGTSTFNNVTVSGTLNMDAGTTATITNLSTPVNAGDAATKGYVDTSVADLIDLAPGALDTLNELAAALGDDENFATNVYSAISDQVSAAGDTMTGTLDMGANKVTTTLTPTTDSELTRKGYVDAQDALKVSKAGDTMTGDLAMSSNKVTGVADPVNAQDVATKNYIDTVFGSTVSAANSAANAATSETNAANSASAALTSENNAAQSLADTQAVYDQFDDRYLGTKAVAPTLDNDGNALLIGALYFNETTNSMQVYSSSGWVPAGSSVNGTSARFKYVATANQNTFSGTDANGEVLAYDSGYLDVYLNGVKLTNGDDFTATSGTSIQLLFNASENDVLEIVGYGTFQLADIAINDMTDVNTAGLVDGDVLVYNATSGDFEPGFAPIEDASVVTAKIADDAVNQAKLADNSVGSAQIIDGSVNDAEIGTVNATAIDYDNTVSGISGNTVQEAIDYLNTLSGGSSGDVASYTRDKFVATAGQTTFTTSNGYTLGYLQVFVNGILLDITDYTANDESTIVLTEAADAGDEVVAIALDSFAIAELLRVTSVSASATQNSFHIGVDGVGINTTDPQGTLHVTKNYDIQPVPYGAEASVVIGGAIDGGGTQGYLGGLWFASGDADEQYDNGQFGKSAGILGYAYDDYAAGQKDGELRFFTTPALSTTPTQAMVIKGNGRVGINNPTPTGLLDVLGDSEPTYVSVRSGATGQAAYLQFGDTQERSAIYGGYGSGGGGYLAVRTDTTGGTPLERLRVHNNGAVTLPNQPIFRRTRNGATHGSYTPSDGSKTTLGAATVIDNGNNLSNDRFTAPVAGHYYFSLTVSWYNGTGSDDSMTFGFCRNNVYTGDNRDGGTADYIQTATSPQYFSRAGVEMSDTISGVIYLNEGDFVNPCFGNVSAGGEDIWGVSWSGYLIG